MNSVCLIGRVTKDIELKTTQSGKSVASFTIAVDKGKEADFIPVIAWEKTAEFVSRFFGKGKKIAITGKLAQRTYTDKDNKNHSVIEVIANSVDFCESKPDVIDKDGNNYDPSTSRGGFVEVPNDGDLPF